MALYIKWTEEEQEFVKWRYAGGGITSPVMKTVIKEHKVRWSTEETKEMKRRAREYIKTDFTDRPDAKLVIIPDEQISS